MTSVAETNTTPLIVAGSDMSASAIQLTPPRPMDVDGEGERVVECPPAPRRRARSASEAEEAAAYDAVVRQLVGELTTRLDSLPAVEGLVSPSGLQRQQAFDPAAPRVCSPVTMESPAALYVVGAARQVSADLDLADAGSASPLKRRETDSEAGDQPASPLKRRETDIEGDLGAAADTNTSELSPAAEADEASGSEDEELEVSGSEEETDSEEVSDDGAEADNEGGATIEHVESAEETNTGGLYLSFHRQTETGELALRLEAPVWMMGVLVSVVTAYMWMVAYLIKRG
jgi:hypothetical protein